MPLCHPIKNAKAAATITACGRRLLRSQAAVNDYATSDTGATGEEEPRRAALKHRARASRPPRASDLLGACLPFGPYHPAGVSRAPGRSRSPRARLPSETIDKALEKRDLLHLVYKPPRYTANLSLVNTAKYDPVTWRAQLLRDARDLRGDKGGKARITPATITAKHIAPSDSQTLQVLGPQLSHEERLYCHKRGYSELDVATWSKILTTEDHDLAASILRNGNGPSAAEFMSKPIPSFLPLTLLRRPYLGPIALRDIIIRLWSELRRRKRLPHGRSTLDSSTMFVLIVRLLRRARESWPEALVTVTQMFLKYFTLGKSSSSTTTYDQRLKRHNLLHNKMLSLLALPTRSTPYSAIPHHQRAQFDVIAAMATHDPQLVISREGFQAIASVQAAHQKTPQEQDWSQLKSKSWPPWKQDRTGMDADKGFEYGSTRAMQVIRRAAEAGYARESYEKTVQILAGWDTDRSPTIQTRSRRLHEFLSMPRTPVAADNSETNRTLTSGSKVVTSTMWASRVEATRTVREAWACFLSYQDQRLVESRHSDRSLVYNAMLRKLLVDVVDVDSEEEEGDLETVRRSLEPGDYREVLPEPVSPKELTWLHTDPPSAIQLVREMYNLSIPFDANSLALLLDKARSPEHGLRRLTYASKQIPMVVVLMNPKMAEPSALAQIPSLVFAAFLRLLCRYPSITRTKDGRPLSEHSAIPFEQAVELVLRHPSPEEKHLRSLLGALQARSYWLHGIDIEPKGPEGTPGSFIKRILFWRDFTARFQSESRRAQNIPNIDMLALDLYEKAVVSAITIQNQRRTNPTAVNASIPQNEVRDILETTAETMKSAFYRAAEGSPSTHNDVLSPSQQPPAMPTLLEIPNPATIHTMVRLLGFLTDYRGILDLFTWIAKHETIIRAAAEQPRSGLALIRRAVVAARVCFERAWVEGSMESEELSSLAAPEEMREELIGVMEGTELFGKWPSDVEVWRYVEKGRGTFPVVKE